MVAQSSGAKLSLKNMVANSSLNKYKNLFLEVSVLGKYKNILEISASGEYKKSFRSYLWCVIEFLFQKSIKFFLKGGLEFLFW